MAHNKSSGQNLWSPYPQHKGLQCATPLIILHIVSAIPSIFLNGCVLYILTKSRTLRNRPSTAFMLSLTIADLIVSGIDQPLAIVILFNSRSPFIEEGWIYLQRVAFYMNCVTCSASAASLLLVSIDRYIYLAFPLKYELIMTKPKVNAGLIFVWFGSLVAGLTPWYKGAKMYIHYYFCLFSLVLTVKVMMFIYWRTVSIAKALVHPTGSDSHSGGPWKKAARTGVVLVSIFVFCWFPSAIIGLILSMSSQEEAWSRDKSEVPKVVTSTPPLLVELFFSAMLLGHLNSLFNPIIYSVRDCQIKERFHRLFKKRKSDRNSRWSKNSFAPAVSTVSISNIA